MLSVSLFKPFGFTSIFCHIEKKQEKHLGPHVLCIHKNNHPFLGEDRREERGKNKDTCEKCE